MSAPSASGVSIREFARLAECDEKQVRRAIESGRLARLADGSIDPAQANEDWRRATRRTPPKRADKPRADSADKRKVSAPQRRTAVSAPTAQPDETPAEAAERIVRELGASMSLNEALRVKENYTALLKRFEFDSKSGAVVEVAFVSKAVAEDYAKVRSKLLSIPAEQAPILHRCKTVTELQDRLLTLITRVLEELSFDGERSAA